MSQTEQDIERRDKHLRLDEQSRHICLPNLTLDDAGALISAVFEAREQRWDHQPSVECYDRILAELQQVWPIEFVRVRSEFE